MSGQVVRVNRVVQMVFCDNCDAIKTSNNEAIDPKIVAATRESCQAGKGELSAAGWHTSTLCPTCRKAAMQ